MQIIDQLELGGQLLFDAGKFEDCSKVYGTLVHEHNADHWSHLCRMIDTMEKHASSSSGNLQPLGSASLV